MSDFDDDRIDEDLADDWEAMAEEDEAVAAAKAAAEIAARNKKPRKPKHLRTEGDAADDGEDDDEDENANETEEERRARIELQRQIEADQDAAGIFGTSSTVQQVADLSAAPALVTWPKATNAADITKIRGRVLEVVARFSKNPNFVACILPAFNSMLKGLDTASLENMRTYLDTCKDSIDAKRDAKKAEKKKADEEAKVQAEATAVSRSSQRARETGDLFGAVQDKAGKSENQEEFSMF